MGFSLTDLFTNGNVQNTRQSTQTDAAGNAASVSVTAKNAAAAAKAVSAMQQGQSFSGQVTQLHGDQVVLNLGNQVEITAHVDQDTPLQVGQQVLFEVRSNQNNKLSLVPLRLNLSGESPAALSALKAAALPDTEANVAMVKAMMQEGMSVDKSSLWNMSRLTASFSSFQPELVVQLSSLQMEVSQSNLEQLQAYQNSMHQIAGSFETLTGQIGQVLDSFAQDGSYEAGMQFMKDMLQILQSGSEEAVPVQNGMTQTGMTQTGTTQNGMTQTGVGQTAGAAAANEIQTGAVQPDAVQNSTLQNGAMSAGTMQDHATQNTQLQNLIKGFTEQLAALSEQGMANVDSLQNQLQSLSGQLSNLSAQSSANGDLQTMLQLQTLQDVVKGFTKQLRAMPEQLTANNAAAVLQQGDPALQQGNPVLQQGNPVLQNLVKNVLQQLTAFSEQSSKGGAMQYTELSSAFEKLFSAQVNAQWRMQPEDFSDKEEVRAFYQKLEQQSKQLTSLFAEAGKTQTAAGHTLQQLNQNLDFMHQLNQLIPYLQIPLKANLESAQGELYVYSGKKEKAVSDGSVSALLHLDMKHLGTMDVYVKLQEKNVSTHFYLEDDQMIDFLAQHMDQLDEHLRQKGYSLHAEVTTREEQPGGTDGDFFSRLKGEQSGERSLVSVHTFDVRA